MGQARGYELSEKQVEWILGDQIAMAIDNAMARLETSPAKRDEIIVALKQECRCILKGEMIYPL